MSKPIDLRDRHCATTIVADIFPVIIFQTDAPAAVHALAPIRRAGYAAINCVAGDFLQQGLGVTAEKKRTMGFALKIFSAVLSRCCKSGNAFDALYTTSHCDTSGLANLPRFTMPYSVDDRLISHARSKSRTVCSGKRGEIS